MPTTVALDLAFLQPGATGGMEIYARQLVPALARARPDLRFVAFCGRELAAELRREPWVEGMRLVELPVSSGSRFRRVAVEQAVEPALIRRTRPDLVHSLGNTAPLAPLGAPLVVTIHDVIWARHPETHAGLLAKGLGQLVPRAARAAARVIADSASTRNDLQQLLGIDPDKVDVVPLGPGLPGGVVPSDPEALRARLGIEPDARIVLCPAPPRPHKNVRRLAEALAGVDATLVVPGYAAGAAAVDLDVPGTRVVGAGWLEQPDLEALYGEAVCLAFPSLAEGFGLPVLEAMLRGVPVACSDGTSLPEVAGDAALLFDAHDVGAIRDAVVRLLDDPALRRDFSARGVERAARFTWDACAAGTLAVYDRVLAP